MTPAQTRSSGNNVAFMPPEKPSMDTLRIGHGNFWINNPRPASGLTIVRQCKPDSWGFNEAYKQATRLDKMKSFNNMRARVNGDNTSAAVKKDMWDAKDCQTIVRKEHEILYHSVVKASKDVPPYALGHDRQINTVVYKKNGFGVPVAHINLHPNPINMFGPANITPLVQEYIKNAVKLDRVILSLKAMGYYNIVITGDVNLTLAKSRKREYPTIYSVARDHDLSVWSHGLDAIFWTPNLRPVKRDVIPGAHGKPGIHGGDHPWFWFDFKVA